MNEDTYHVGWVVCLLVCGGRRGVWSSRRWSSTGGLGVCISAVDRTGGLPPVYPSATLALITHFLISSSEALLLLLQHTGACSQRHMPITRRGGGVTGLQCTESIHAFMLDCMAFLFICF